MSSPQYRVELDVFSGPLDLLLYLVRRDEVDIVDLPIARITAQFAEFLDVLGFIDLDLTGDFIVMASTLTEIKSRLVLPRPEENEDDLSEVSEDPRSDLIKQLLEYKKYKDVSRALDERAAKWQERYPRLSDDRPTGGKNPAADRIKEVELWDLVSALARVVERTQVEERSNIRYDDTPISKYVEIIGTRVRAEERVAFTSFFEGARSKSKIVGIFLAILELLRHHGFRAEQECEFGEIWIIEPLPETPEGAGEGETAQAPPTKNSVEERPPSEGSSEGETV